MDKVRVNTGELKLTLVDNLATHVAKYDEAVSAYKILLLRKLGKLYKEVEADVEVDLYIDLLKPENHADDYETIIAMLDMSIDDITSLTMNEFRQYVEDKWTWKKNFQETFVAYTSAV